VSANARRFQPKAQVEDRVRTIQIHEFPGVFRGKELRLQRTNSSDYHGTGEASLYEDEPHDAVDPKVRDCWETGHLSHEGHHKDLK
jgi:hypothetical protein